MGIFMIDSYKDKTDRRHCKMSSKKELFYKGTLWQVEEGGRVEPERRLEGQQFTKLGRKYQHD
jgi:hypothetical protein